MSAIDAAFGLFLNICLWSKTFLKLKKELALSCDADFGPPVRSVVISNFTPVNITNKTAEEVERLSRLLPSSDVPHCLWVFAYMYLCMCIFPCSPVLLSQGAKDLLFSMAS